MAPRPTWTGAIDFGGFPIHLRAYPLVKSKSAESFKTLCPCHGAPISSVRACSVEQDVVDAEHVTVRGPLDLADCGKGVKVGKDIKALPDDALEALAKGDRTDVITIHDLCPRASVPLYLAQAHYRMVPDKDVAGSEGPAGILWNGLLANERVLMSEWVPRSGSRNQLLAIEADVYGLTGVVLPYSTDFNEVPEHPFEENEQAAAMFEAFAQQQSIPLDDFTHTKYTDTYGEQRKAAIEAALKGDPVPTGTKPAAKPAVPDLMAAMQAAMQSTPAKPKAKRAPAKAKKEVKA